LPFQWKLISGAIAGVCGTVCIFPVDVAKTKLQASPSGTYNGVIDCLLKSVRKDGVFIYRGLESNLIGVIPEKAIKLGVNSQLRESLADPITGKVSLQSEIMAGAGAGLVQLVATNPMETVKIRMQLGAPNLMALVKELGVMGMYKGSLSTLVRDIPFSMVFFSLAAKSKEYLVRRRGGTVFDSPTLTESLAGGIFGGFVAAAISTPADVVKTTIQSGQIKTAGYVDTVQTIYNEGGVKAFTRGMGPRMMTIGPLFGIAILVYDKVEKMVKSHSVH